MTKSYQHKAIVSLALIAMAVAVGCGDGRRSGRSNVRRTLPTKVATKTPAPNGQNSLNPRTTSDPDNSAKTPANADKVDKTQIEDVKAKDKKIVDSINAQLAGNGARITDLGAGTFTLDKISTSLVYNPSSGNPARTYKEWGITGGAAPQSLSEVNYGMIQNDYDEGREIRFPVTFNIEAGKAFETQEVPSQSMVIKAISAQMNTVLIALDKFQESSANALVTDLRELMAGGKATLADGKKVVTSLIIQNDHLIIDLRIDEKLIDQTNAKPSNAKQGSFSRELIFSYKFAAAQATAQATQTTTVNSAAEVAATPTTGDPSSGPAAATSSDNQN